MQEKNKCDVMSMLSPEMKQVVEKQKELAAGCFATGGTIEKLRSNYEEERRFWNKGGPCPAQMKDIVCPVKGGEISLRMHYPSQPANAPAIVFIHGGGFAAGSNDTHSRIMRTLCDKAGSLVIGVEYRLAPEYKMPVQIDDCTAAIDYVLENRESLGVGTKGLILAGDSGGAVLCMIMALYYRDERKDNSFIEGLLLYYGTYGLEDSISRRMMGCEADGMRKEDLDYYMAMLVDKPGDFMKYMHMFDMDLTFGIPRTYICCGNLDPLRDDSVLLYEILKSHGIEARLDIYEGLLHAFLHYFKMVPQAEEAIERGVNFVCRPAELSDEQK